MPLGKAERSEVASIIVNACVNNLPLDLRIIGDKARTVGRSRFLSLDESLEQPILVIEAPASKGNVVPVHPEQEVKVSFSHHGQKRSFTTLVAGRGKFELNPEVAVHTLELFVPEHISSGGKRGFYRITFDDTMQIEVKLSVLAREEGKAGRVRSRVTGIITDIGGGGLGFRISEGKSLLLSPETRLQLEFELPVEDGQIRLSGRICFSLRRPELREVFFGVQFVELDSDVQYRRNVDRILRFVAERQRDSLREPTRINP